jgi:glucose-6-phosphate 1-epimerase
VYLDVPGPIVVYGPGAGDRVVVESEGFPDAVLWNPGAEKGRAIADLGPDEYRRMLCVEAAVVGAPVRLDAGARWRGRQLLHADP